jgi:hypothetical protein
MRAAGAIAFGTVLSLLAFASCGGKTEVTIELLDPCKSEGASFRAAADYVEFAVFPSKCPDDTLLAAGLTNSARYRKVVKSSSGLPEVGDLPKEKFGFAAVLRDENCGVIGFGCTNADLENTKKIIVAVRAWATPAGKNDPSAYCTPLTGGGCPPSKVCSNGNCKKVNEDDAGGCTLAIAAGGKLPAPVVAGASVSGPAITATDSGFVMAYRDQDPTSGFPRVIVYYVSDEGVPGNPGKFDLIGCPGKELKDGVGATYSKGNGLIATSLPNCDSLKGAGAVFLPFDDQGLVSNAAGPQNAAFNELTMGPASSVAAGAADGDFEVVYRTVTSQPAIERVVLTGSEFKAGVSIVHPFGDGDYPFGLVATSSTVRALLAPVGAETQVIIGTKVGDTLDTAPSTMTFPTAGAWAALTAWSNRVAAAVPASSGISVKVGQLGAATGEAGTPEIFSDTVGSTTATSGALAVLRSHLFVAQARAGGLTLHNLEDADGTIKLPASTPAPTEGGTEGGASTSAGSVDLQTNLGDATLANFSGTQLAMAAARNRVAIVWLTKPKLGETDPTGGWALLRCNE